ncbi:MAG: RagB/SusD family nutrient uptake outer membrane protein [Paludibacter sp.]|nr:RagB/SusD family nutrient uptake outer membrane protein [Paludibacter sp.]
MKKLTIYIATLFLFGFQGCTSWLDVKPENEVVLENYWQTESQATAVLSAGYRGMTEDVFVERMLVWGELRSDNLVEGNSTNINMLKILNVNLTSSNDYSNWASFYSVINYCNTFLHFAPGVLKTDQNFTVDKLNSLNAEALTIRALCYFYLVRAFNEVPLILTPSISDTQDYYVAKSSERDILNQIITDLKTAQLTARADYGKGAYNKGRITLNTINALLADVYLWDQQYSNCVDLCNGIIADPKLTLVTGDKMLKDVFYTGNSTESIFELQFNKDIQVNNTPNMFFGYEGNRAGQLSFPVFLVQTGTFSPFNYAASSVKESTDDKRKSSFFGTSANGTGYSIYKYALIQGIVNADETITPEYRPLSTTVNWIVYRLSDVLLMKAEALVQLDRNDNDLKEALKMVNTTYLRSNTTADSLLFNNYNSKGSMESLVLRERQRELMFEGKRWFDLLRLARRNNNPSAMLAYISPKLSGDNLQSNKLKVMNALYMPILKSELVINPNLIQNPFYLDTNASN